MLTILLSMCAITGTAMGTSPSQDVANFIDKTKEEISNEIYKNIESNNFITDYERQQGLQIGRHHKILFDTDSIVADVFKVGADEYYVIKQNNWFSFAHRLDIYTSNGDTVEDKNIARKVFEIYGWRLNIDKLSELNKAELVTISQESEKMYRWCSLLHSGVGAVVTAIDEVQKLEIGSVSVWDTATKLSPKLAYFEKNTREIDECALDGKNKSSRLNTCLPNLINDLDKYDSGEELDWERFAYNANETGYAMDTFFCDMCRPGAKSVGTVRKTIKTVNKGFDSIGCGFLGDALDSLDERLEEAIIVKPHYEIQHEYESILENTHDAESDAYIKWSKSIDGDNATWFIYGLIVLAIILIIVSILLLLKQSHDIIGHPIIVGSVIVGCIITLIGSLTVALFMFANTIKFTYGLIMLAIILIIVLIFLFIVSVFLSVKQGHDDNINYPISGSVPTLFFSSIRAVCTFVLIWYFTKYFGISTNILVFSLYVMAMMVLWMTIMGSFSQRIYSIVNEWSAIYPTLLFLSLLAVISLLCTMFLVPEDIPEILSSFTLFSFFIVIFLTIIAIDLAVDIWRAIVVFKK